MHKRKIYFTPKPLDFSRTVQHYSKLFIWVTDFAKRPPKLFLFLCRVPGPVNHGRPWLAGSSPAGDGAVAGGTSGAERTRSAPWHGTEPRRGGPRRAEAWRRRHGPKTSVETMRTWWNMKSTSFRRLLTSDLSRWVGETMAGGWSSTVRGGVTVCGEVLCR